MSSPTHDVGLCSAGQVPWDFLGIRDDSFCCECDINALFLQTPKVIGQRECCSKMNDCSVVVKRKVGQDRGIQLGVSFLYPQPPVISYWGFHINGEIIAHSDVQSVTSPTIVDVLPHL